MSPTLFIVIGFVVAVAGAFTIGFLVGAFMANGNEKDRP